MNFDDILIVIPARFSSKRLPGKPLVPIAGVPMIIRTAKQCAAVVPRDRIVVATDDQRIVDVCLEHGFRAELTRDNHLTGTDRVAEIAARIPARTYVNVQGDEPVFEPDDIRAIIDASNANPTATFIGSCALTEAQWRDSKYIKLLVGLDQQLIYIGRAMVPGSHDGGFHGGSRQVCAYAYTSEVLAKYASVAARTPLEAIEDCEVVRFLELSIPVTVIPMSDRSMSVDRPEDVLRVEATIEASTH
ncbi:3-deoxy-manno-octulosonate cytidylyltransferase [Microbacterium laevaniformans]|uniref:3-deoxy-manno-octulosonate cytidylyltransferase n=1 Tax=Microbacterium laevaniformans TaxID=36807 RepID=UPI001958ED67|nr:3-deoxy-manno-octulosonate cytidylyltransferase [Microbacterium laevaniformans]MBM7751587.1 3-deoxy-manno-octulosonate cytidylyltransferase (CMP-KDO synthetase) [Microbacterium laevaniformans]GLJ63746.1 3-deoxy-manno-octulosonate cytidylyltransferase [Microbacterium laevaniformans]